MAMHQARNCYVAEGGAVFKVGGVISLERDDRWTAPEVLAGGTATPASDIWVRHLLQLQPDQCDRHCAAVVSVERLLPSLGTACAMQVELP